jgi:hypothetical protein
MFFIISFFASSKPGCIAPGVAFARARAMSWSVVALREGNSGIGVFVPLEGGEKVVGVAVTGAGSFGRA